MVVSIKNFLTAIVDLHDDIGQFVDSYDLLPAKNSQAEKEMKYFSREESVRSSYSQGWLLAEVAADQLMAFTKTVIEPAQSVAPWTCIRASLEASALASWLLNPDIDVVTRVKRIFAFRYEGLIQQVKFLRSVGEEAYIEKVESRIDEVEQTALKLGFPRIQDKNQKRIGIGILMPSVTDIIQSEINEESNYRLLSAFAHAHGWAITLGSYQRIDNNEEKTVREFKNGRDPVLEKYLSPVSVFSLGYTGTMSLIRPVWYKSLLFGWDVKKISDLLEKNFDSIGIKDESRFWRNFKQQ
jgi:hypothetical protein